MDGHRRGADPQPRSGLGLRAACERYVVAIGGERIDAALTTIDAVEDYDTTTGEWRPLPPLHIPPARARSSGHRIEHLRPRRIGRRRQSPRHDGRRAPVSGVIGADIYGLDLAAPLDDDAVRQLRRVFNERQVLFFRDQHLSPEQQIALGRRFGELGTHPYVAANAKHPEIIDVVTEPDDRVNFGGGWHSDVTFLPAPDLGSILYAVELPPFGGDTLFASQLAAYDALSDTMKALLDGLVGVHSAGPQYGGAGYSTQSSAIVTQRAAEAAASRVEHPVVRTHPETGRKGLYGELGVHRRHQGHAPRRVEGAAVVPVPARDG